MRAIGPRHLDLYRVLLRRWHLAAGAVVLGLVAVAVPDSPSSRWACVAGLIVLYPVIGSVVMSRSVPFQDATPVALDGEPAPSASAQVVDAASDPATTRLALALTPARRRAPTPVPVLDTPAIVQVDARAELLVARGEAMRELFAANAGRAPELVTEAGGLVAAVPTQKGPTALESVPAVALDPGACWVPLPDDAVAGPALHSGWPFDSRVAEPAGAERPVVAG